jgi:hypothetical protein
MTSYQKLQKENQELQKKVKELTVINNYENTVNIYKDQCITLINLLNLYRFENINFSSLEKLEEFKLEYNSITLVENEHQFPEDSNFKKKRLTIYFYFGKHLLIQLEHTYIAVLDSEVILLRNIWDKFYHTLFKFCLLAQDTEHSTQVEGKCLPIKSVQTLIKEGWKELLPTKSE